MSIESVEEEEVCKVWSVGQQPKEGKDKGMAMGASTHVRGHISTHRGVARVAVG